jgi:hypothetical protein
VGETLFNLILCFTQQSLKGDVIESVSSSLLSDAVAPRDDAAVTSVRRGVVGLPNVGNTCCINASLHCISFFLPAEWAKPVESDNIVVRSLYPVVRAIQQGTSPSTKTMRVLQSSVQSEYKLNLENKQEDSSEILGLFIDTVRAHLNTGVRAIGVTEVSYCHGNTRTLTQDAVNWVQCKARPSGDLVDSRDQKQVWGLKAAIADAERGENKTWDCTEAGCCHSKGCLENRVQRLDEARRDIYTPRNKLPVDDISYLHSGSAEWVAIYREIKETCVETCPHRDLPTNTDQVDIQRTLTKLRGTMFLVDDSDDDDDAIEKRRSNATQQKTIDELVVRLKSEEDVLAKESESRQCKSQTHTPNGDYFPVSIDRHGFDRHGGVQNKDRAPMAIPEHLDMKMPDDTTQRFGLQSSSARW